ncbi:uncharacterized protein ARMOST_21475 [Armillaria ostoyae]|uniref:Uncharacterized protein n=1 Tax=Armillaria ostoyae TaxID=47428 RepID=A0A284SA59_ARMOS|nr:uncharacterized protein ARMOST_21475 [Armillaria ostoyae]
MTSTHVPIAKDAVTEDQETLVDPKDLVSSRSGCRNSVIVCRPSQSSAAAFDLLYKFNNTLGPTGGSNIDAIYTTAFYITNDVPEYAYEYGWTLQLC